MLAVQQLDLPIGAAGLDTGTDERRLPAPKLAVLKNARVTKTGKLRKRRGFVSTYAAVGVNGLFSSGDEVLVTNTDGTIRNLTFTTPGYLAATSPRVHVDEFGAPLLFQESTDTLWASESNSACWVFVQAATTGTTRLIVSVLDSAGKQIFRDEFSVDSCLSVDIAALSTGFMIAANVEVTSGTRRIYTRTLNSDGTALGAWTNSTIEPTTTRVLIAPDPARSGYVVVYSDGTDILSRTVTPLQVFASPTTKLFTANDLTDAHVHVRPTGDSMCITLPGTLMVGEVSVVASAVTTSTLLWTSSFALSGITYSCTFMIGADTAIGFHSYGDVEGGQTGVYTYDSSGTPSSVDTSANRLMAKMSYDGTLFWGLMGSRNPLNCAPVLTSWTVLGEKTRVCCFGYRTVPSRETTPGIDFSTISSDATKVRVVFLESSEITPTGTSLADFPDARVFTPTCVRVDRAPSFVAALPVAQGAALLTSGTPAVWDGTKLMAITPPPLPYAELTDAATGGSIDADNGDVFLCAFRLSQVYQNGDLAFSPLLGPTPVTWSAGSVSAGLIGTAFASVSPSTPRGPNSGVFAEYYRSTRNGTVLYRESTFPYNQDTQAAPFALNLVASDDDLVLRPALSLSLTPTVPPPFRHAAAGAERLFGLSADGTRIYPTLLREPGFGPAFAEEIVIELGAIGREATAVAALDAALIIFTADAIYAISGDGPDNTGAGAWPPPQLVVQGYGTTEPQSVINTPDGVWFRSATGWRMLNRSLQLARNEGGGFMGEEADAYIGSTVYQAVLVPQQSEVRWTLGATGILVYNYEYNIWSLWEVQGEPRAACVDSTGRMWYCHQPGSAVYRESASDSFDAIVPGVPIFVPMTIRTGKIHVAGIKGFQRLRRVALEHDTESAHGMTVRVYVDGETTASTIRTWSEGEIAALPATLARSLQVHVAKQKGSYFELEIVDTAPAVVGTGAGYSIVGAQIEIGTKMGNAKQLPASNKK